MTQMSKEYASALFVLASEEDCRESVADSLSVMTEVFRQSDGIEELLSSPALSKDERLAIIDSAFSSLHEYALSFLKLLCEKNLVSTFVACAQEYARLHDASINISSAKVTSAVRLDGTQLDALRQKLEAMCGHTVVLETEVDSSLLGGMTIEVDGKVIDASLRRRLSDVKDVISR